MLPYGKRNGRRWLIAFALLMIAAILTGLWTLGRARCFAIGGPIVCRIETSRPLVALTFDDGPSLTGVESVLPLLKAHHARATFFLIGQEIARKPQLARALVAAGQEIGNHSYSHQRMVGHSQAFYADEIARTDRLIAAVGGRPGLFRPPNGKKLIGLPSAVRRAGRTLVMWDVEDASTGDPAAFARAVVAEARPGSIILLHVMSGPNRTARAALPLILDGLTAKGLRPVSVGELMRAGAA